MARSKYRDDERPLAASSDEPLVVAEPQDSADQFEVGLLPPAGKSRAVLEAEMNGQFPAKLPLADNERIAAKRETFRFSLRELMAFTTFAAFGLSGASWLRPDLFAGVVGLVVSLSLLLIAFRPPQTRIMKLAWTCAIVIYLFAALVAVLKS
jgi:hypothetical protein